MERLIKGDLIVIPFPFSDLSTTKKRPALVLAVLDGDDILLAQITSSRSDKYSIRLEKKDFKEGNIDVQSYIRPNKLFTADKSLILYRLGTIQENKIKETIQKIEQILKE